jgi:hypothetical protein
MPPVPIGVQGCEIKSAMAERFANVPGYECFWQDECGYGLPSRANQSAYELLVFPAPAMYRSLFYAYKTNLPVLGASDPPMQGTHALTYDLI